jgi:hypothetical protein
MLIFKTQERLKKLTVNITWKFKAGIRTVNDAGSSGYLFTSKTDKNVMQIKDTVHENRCLTICNSASAPDYHLDPAKAF